jgi:hypothetical protein
VVIVPALAVIIGLRMKLSGSAALIKRKKWRSQSEVSYDRPCEFELGTGSEIRAVLASAEYGTPAFSSRRYHSAMSGYLTYAKTLTLHQWREEIFGRLWKQIEREIDLMACLDPVLSIARELELDLPGDADIWDVHNVTISKDSCSVFMSFEYGVFTYPDVRRPATNVGPEPVETNVAGDRYYYLFDVSVVFQINDNADVSIEILDICAQAPETPEAEWGK